MSRLKVGDMFHMVRTSCGGLGLSLLRENRLIFAVGAVSSVPLGEEVCAGIPFDCVQEAESAFQKLDPKFELQELPLLISIGDQLRIRFRGWQEIGQYVCWIEHGHLCGIPGEDACASIALKGACGEIPASATAQLLNGGEMEIVDW